MRRFAVAVSAVIAAGAAMAGEPRSWSVCPVPGTGCDFAGGPGIQAAVDAAAPGDTVNLRSGRYVAAAYREIPYQEVVVRGFVVIDGRTFPSRAIRVRCWTAPGARRLPR